MNPQELKSIAVLQAMDADALARLAAALEPKSFTEGQTVFAEGDPGDSMYFIANGRVRIEKRAQAAGGQQKTLTVLQPGDYLGEMALFDQKPRSASAVAAEPAMLLRLSKAAFDDLQKGTSVAALGMLFAMIRTSSERIRRLTAQVVVYDEVGKAIGEARDLQGLLQVILQQLSFATSADWGLVVLRSQFSERLELCSQANLALTQAQLQAISSGEGFIGCVLQEPRHHLIDSVDEQEPFKSCVRLGFETPSLLVSPLALEDQVLGLIALGGRQRAQFDADALNLVRGVARQAVQAILNARHREEEQARSRHSRQFVRF